MDYAGVFRQTEAASASRLRVHDQALDPLLDEADEMFRRYVFEVSPPARGELKRPGLRALYRQHVEVRLTGVTGQNLYRPLTGYDTETSPSRATGSSMF